MGPLDAGLYFHTETILSAFLVNAMIITPIHSVQAQRIKKKEVNEFVVRHRICQVPFAGTKRSQEQPLITI